MTINIRMRHPYSYRCPEIITLPSGGDVVHAMFFTDVEVDTFDVGGFELRTLDGSTSYLNTVSVHDVRIDGRSLIKPASQRRPVSYFMATEAADACTTRHLRRGGRVEVWLVSLSKRLTSTTKLRLTLRGLCKTRAN